MPRFSMARLLGNGASSQSARFAVAATQFHADVMDSLLAGCLQGLAAGGVPASAVDVVRVPGAFELPLACQELAASGRYGAVVALGCVIRGETAHFDFVAGECCRGLMEAGLRTRVPVILGVLTTDTLAQARRRADPAARRGSAPPAAAAARAKVKGGRAPGSSSNKPGSSSNKGWECAEVALQMAGLLGRLRAGVPA
jgi:6,7-dimethyl-8-ribityllumazine synthase